MTTIIFEVIEFILFVFLIFGTIAVLVVTNINTQNRYNQAINTIAELKCPMMQYETTIPVELNETLCNPELIGYLCSNACDYYKQGLVSPYAEVRPATPIDTECYNKCFFNISRTCKYESLNYHNFTTGRYIDGKIECLGGEVTNKWVCQKPLCIPYNYCITGNYDNYYCQFAVGCVNHPNSDDCKICKPYCHVEQDYEKSQKFTLEEMGLNG